MLKILANISRESTSQVSKTAMCLTARLGDQFLCQPRFTAEKSKAQKLSKLLKVT